MTVKEFTVKTLAFIVLPGLMFYGVRSWQAMGDSQLVAFKRCVRRLQQTPPLALAIYGDQDQKKRWVTSPVVLRQLPRHTAALRWEYMPVGQYRSPRRGCSYRLAVTAQDQAVSDITLSQTNSGQEVVVWGGYSVFVDEQRLFLPFIDSLYRHTAAEPAAVIDLR